MAEYRVARYPLYPPDHATHRVLKEAIRIPVARQGGSLELLEAARGAFETRSTSEARGVSQLQQK